MMENIKFKQGTEYVWEPTSEITITGHEFEVLMNNLSRFLTTPVNNFTVPVYSLLDQCGAILNSVFVRMVEQGVAKEPSKEETIVTEQTI